MSQFIFVYAPSNLKDIKVFLPKRPLAVMAQILKENYVETAIFDFGVPNSIEFLQENTTTSSVSKNSIGKTKKWNSLVSKIFGKHKDDIAVREQRYIQWVHRNIKITPKTACILFWIENRGDLVIARHVAKQIREDEPERELFIIACGPYFKHTGPYIVTYLPEFNGILLNHCELSILPLWKYLVSGKPIHSIPNYAYSEWGEIHMGPVSRLLSLDELPIPTYDTYESLLRGEKFNIFTLEQTRDGRMGYAEPYILKQPINASIESLIHESHALRGRYYTSTFHIAGEMTSLTDVQSFALALLKSAHFINYSRSFHCLNVQGESVHSLHLSGCRAISVEIPTGSQRLLSKYYGLMRTISSFETAMTAFASSGLYTTIQCSYPCAEEDRHTFAETVRLIQRIKPDSVRVLPVYLWPDSLWWENMQSFNLNIDTSDYFTWLAGQHSANNYPYWKSFEPYLLEDEATKLGISIYGGEVMGLIAHVLQIPKEQKLFKQIYEKILSEGDANSMQDWIAQFNTMSRKRIKEEEWNIRKSDFKAVAN
ncbi:MAG TPA: hypothetical protein PLJ10_02185 [Candidatus Hydrogenedens sp.]|nr:hypothetical protein [Candidatus Hydrogenedens sp.]